MPLTVSALLVPDFMGTPELDHVAAAITTHGDAGHGSPLALSVHFEPRTQWEVQIASAHLLTRTTDGLTSKVPLTIGPDSEIDMVICEIDDLSLGAMMQWLDIQAKDDFDLVFAPGITVMARSGWERRVARGSPDPAKVQDQLDRELVAILPNEPSAHGRLQAIATISRLPALLSVLAGPEILLPEFKVKIK